MTAMEGFTLTLDSWIPYNQTERTPSEGMCGELKEEKKVLFPTNPLTNFLQGNVSPPVGRHTF